MPPKTKSAYLEPIPAELVPFQVGEKVAFPDIVTNPASIVPGSVEERHPEHPLAGMYGRVEAIGVADGLIQFDVTVIDPATGEPTSDELQRVTMEEIQ